MMHALGAVMIGRNEGERLIRCLESVSAAGISRVVYVDSGSSDNSVKEAESLGVRVVHLDLSKPFTAARARNAGFFALMNDPNNQEIEFVQFLDGDCELIAGWVEKALLQLEEKPDIAVACGLRKERFPDSSVYNRMCADEWDTPVGETKACGGDALIRASALMSIGGYRDNLIAGEEPEMCLRLRQAGWKIMRIDADMTFHDADMTRFSQWWKRSERSGYAFAEGVMLHGFGPERHWVKETLRALFWGGFLPTVSLFLSLLSPVFLALFLLYPLQIFRLYLRGGANNYAFAKAFFSVAGKFAESQGVFSYLWSRLRGRERKLIEYKGAVSQR